MICEDMQNEALIRSKFAGMKRIASSIGRLFSRRHYLLMDGTRSCAYIPRRTYRRLTRLLERSMERDPKAENSLRFVWTRCGGEWQLLVNPSKDAAPMICTHGLVKDSGGRILVPCPYLQQIYWVMGLPPEWCGRVDVRFERIPAAGAIGQLGLTEARKAKNEKTEEK